MTDNDWTQVDADNLHAHITAHTKDRIADGIDNNAANEILRRLRKLEDTERKHRHTNQHT